MDYLDLGKRVRARRLELEWTQERLAQEIGVSTSFIGHIERGSRNASIDTLVLLANAMQISTDELLSGSLKKPDNMLDPIWDLTEGQRSAMNQMLEAMKGQISSWNRKDK